MKGWAAAALLLMAALWGLLFWTPAREQQVDTVPAASPQRASPEPPAQTPAHARPPPAASRDTAFVEEQAQIPPARESAALYKLPNFPPPEPQGPVSALKLHFGNESPSGTSKLNEEKLKEALQRTGQAPESIADIVCRRTICRISWRWKRERVIPFMQAIGVLRHDVDPHLGIDAAGPPDAEGVRAIDMYLDVTSKPKAL